MKIENVVRLLDRAGCSCVIWVDIGGFYIGAYKRSEDGSVALDNAIHSNLDDCHPTIAEALEAFAINVVAEQDE